MLSQDQKWIGIDLNKDEININIQPVNESFQVKNSQQGINNLMNKLISMQPKSIILKRAQGKEASIVTKLFLEAFPALVIHSDNAKRLLLEADIEIKNINIEAQDLANLGPYLHSKTTKLTKQIKSQLSSLSVLENQLKEMIQEDTLQLEKITDASKESLSKHIGWLEEQLSDNHQNLKLLIDQIESQQQVTIKSGNIETKDIETKDIDQSLNNKQVTKYYRGQVYKEEKATRQSSTQAIPTKKVTKYYRGQSYEVEVPDYAALAKIKQERSRNN